MYADDCFMLFEYGYCFINYLYIVSVVNSYYGYDNDTRTK